MVLDYALTLFWINLLYWSEEFYVDYNADLFGEFVKVLRKALVAYLKADTSVNQNERYRIQTYRKDVRRIATEMANHTVYVDPMACNCWMQENHGNVTAIKLYDEVKDALEEMF
ncbi:hypothetical protein M9458_056414 [Cirrhinus mrigala]|uniref:Uncharacterized protein n=1 Tax=Cirrhinus mrigala TaxID=683832 RepID=A0ABD0MDB1_CIRMR